MRPTDAKGEADRTFTRLGPASRVPLTNAVALRRVERFFDEFPEAKMFGRVHELKGEAYLAVGAHEKATVSFERALTLTRTDLLGIPIESSLPLQLGLAMASAGDPEGGAKMLLRASITDDSERLDQALRWTYSIDSSSAASFDEWFRQGRDRVALTAPDFSLPGLQQPMVDLDSALDVVTLLNFWSPT